MPTPRTTADLIKNATDKVLGTFGATTPEGQVDGEAVRLVNYYGKKDANFPAVIGDVREARQVIGQGTREQHQITETVDVDFCQKLAIPFSTSVVIPALGLDPWKITDVNQDKHYTSLTLERYRTTKRQRQGLERGNPN